jgi:hypothetical protein
MLQVFWNLPAQQKSPVVIMKFAKWNHYSCSCEPVLPTSLTTHYIV